MVYIAISNKGNLLDVKTASGGQSRRIVYRADVSCHINTLQERGIVLMAKGENENDTY